MKAKTLEKQEIDMSGKKSFGLRSYFRFSVSFHYKLIC